MRSLFRPFAFVATLAMVVASASAAQSTSKPLFPVKPTAVHKSNTTHATTLVKPSTPVKLTPASTTAAKPVAAKTYEPMTKPSASAMSPEQMLNAAHDHFAAKDAKATATDLRNASAALKKESETASKSAKTQLVTMARNLDALATLVERGRIKTERDFAARIGAVEARLDKLNAITAKTKTKPVGKTESKETPKSAVSTAKGVPVPKLMTPAPTKPAPMSKPGTTKK